VLHGVRRAGAGEQGEHVPDGLLHSGIRVENDRAGRVVDQPDRQAHAQFAAAGLGELPSMSRARMKFSWPRLWCLEPQQQPVVEVRRVM
jgi:hypothetical protein